jgi:hypothetical protein
MRGFTPAPPAKEKPAQTPRVSPLHSSSPGFPRPESIRPCTPGRMVRAWRRNGTASARTHSNSRGDWPRTVRSCEVMTVASAHFACAGLERSPSVHSSQVDHLKQRSLFRMKGCHPAKRRRHRRFIGPDLAVKLRSEGRKHSHEVSYPVESGCHCRYAKNRG